MMVPGEMPTDPEKMVVFGPLKFIAEPASSANDAQAPRGTSMLLLDTRLLKNLVMGAGDEGRVTAEPDSNDTAVIARALPEMVES
jgi:hypothetical protein